MSASAPLLDVTAIETFYGPIQAIRGVSLQVAQGQIVTVLGANGAGKTTVLRTISGVLDRNAARCGSRARTSPTCRPIASCGSASAMCPKAARSSRS